MMEDYEEDSIQSRLCSRMYKAFEDGNPFVKFYREEKELLSYVYYENKFLSEQDKVTLRKVLNIKQ